MLRGPMPIVPCVKGLDSLTCSAGRTINIRSVCVPGYCTHRHVIGCVGTVGGPREVGAEHGDDGSLVQADFHEWLDATLCDASEGPSSIQVNLQQRLLSFQQSVCIGATGA